MEISLRYVTRFVYPNSVWESHNALRACPTDNQNQRLLAYHLDVEPGASVFRHVDRWGTKVDTFGIVAPHSELLVTATATVSTADRPSVQDSDVSWFEAQQNAEGFWEYLQPTRHTRWNSALASVARDTVAGAGSCLEAVRAVEDLVHESLDYRPGSTEIGVDIEKVWATREGVCQDFAHLAIAMLRSVGIGARYVSGYFFAANPAKVEASVDAEIVVATHAWVEVAMPEDGWLAIDPTNAAPVGQRHVKIGHGRDYDDVTPLRGVYYGETGHVASAEVTMSTGRIMRQDIPVADMSALRELQQQ